LLDSRTQNRYHAGRIASRAQHEIRSRRWNDWRLSEVEKILGRWCRVQPAMPNISDDPDDPECLRSLVHDGADWILIGEVTTRERLVDQQDRRAALHITIFKPSTAQDGRAHRPQVILTDDAHAEPVVGVGNGQAAETQKQAAGADNREFVRRSRKL